MKKELTQSLPGTPRQPTEVDLENESDSTAGAKVEAESSRLLHEVMVHQVELEMQNEELRETRATLELHAGHFTELYDFA
ncbi:MAG: hypothetical protein WEB53_09070, partial [Akkermansiaceae bacterium]